MANINTSIINSLGFLFPIFKSLLSSSDVNIGNNSKIIENALFIGRNEVDKNIQDVIDSIEREKILFPLAKATQASNNRWLKKFYINVLKKTPEEANTIIAGNGLLNTGLNWIIDGQKRQVLTSFDKALKYRGIISPYTGGQITNNNRISAVGKELITNLFDENNTDTLGQLNAVDVGNSIADSFAKGKFNSLINNRNAFVPIINSDGSRGLKLKQGYQNGLKKRVSNIIQYDRLVDNILPTTNTLVNLESKKQFFNNIFGGEATDKLGYDRTVSLLKDVKATSDMYGAKPEQALSYLAVGYKNKGIDPLHALLDYNTFLSTRQLAVNSFKSEKQLDKFTESLTNQLIESKHNPIMNTLGAGYSALYDVYGSKATGLIDKVQKEYNSNINNNSRMAFSDNNTKIDLLRKTINQYLNPKDQLTPENTQRYNLTTASSYYKTKMFDKSNLLRNSVKNINKNLYNTIKDSSGYLGLSYADQILLKTKGVNNSSLNEILKNKSFRTKDAKRQFISKIKDTLNTTTQNSGFNNFKEYNIFNKAINSRNAKNIPNVLNQRRGILDKSFNKGRRNLLGSLVNVEPTLGGIWKGLTGGGNINLKDYLPQDSVNKIENDMNTSQSKSLKDILIDKAKGLLK